jgi:uncharacterized membrane protein (DUF2068 family)
VASTVRKTPALFVIAVFKLIKAALLIALGIGAIKLLHRDLAETLNDWIDLLRVDPDNRIIHWILNKLLAISPNQLKAASVGTFIYAAVLLTEGIGLLLRKRWAEYLTIIATSGLIPVELYEIARHVTVSRIGVLAVNLAIVAYLISEVRRSRHLVHS